MLRKVHFYIILGSGSVEELLLSPQHMTHGSSLWSIYTYFGGKSHLLGLLAHMNVSASSLKCM